jgi:hypothetical protein
MIDQLARAELEHWASDPTWLPDAKLLPARGPIPILRDVDVGRMVDDVFTNTADALTPAALPPGARTYELLTTAALQARADHDGHEVMFIRFSATFYKGKPGVRFGFDVSTLLPTSSKGMVLCCCGATDLFEDHAGHWTLTARQGVVCS